MRHPCFKAMLAWCAVAILTACKSEEAKTEKAAAPAAPHAAVVQLASKYGAVHDWAKPLEENPFQRSYSIELEDILITKLEGKPIVVVSNVQDVFRHDGELWIQLSSLSLWPRIDFRLRCQKEKLEPVFKNRYFLGKFAVVAKISKFQKVVIALRATAFEAGEAEITLEPPFVNTYLASGECIHVEYLERSGAERKER